MEREQPLVVGTPPPDDAWRTFLDDTWHTFLSGLSPSGFPQDDTWRASPIRTSSGRGTRHSQNITFGRPTYPIRICFVQIVDWSKQVLHVIPTGCHDPRSATYRVKGQEWSDGKSPPTIFNNRGTSHDLCQPLVGWWWPCHHLEASWQAKISPYH